MTEVQRGARKGYLPGLTFLVGIPHFGMTEYIYLHSKEYVLGVDIYFSTILN